MRKDLKIAAMAAGLFVALFFAHPWLLSVPDRVAEARMQREVHVGMTRRQVEATLRQSGSTFRDGTAFVPEYDRKGRTYLMASYLHFGTLCVASEMQYFFGFDAHGVLRLITRHLHGDAC